MARRQAESKWGFRVAITPSPSKIAKLFGDSGKEFANFKPAFQSLAPKMVEGIRRIYASKGAVIGEPWPGLKSKYYLAKKARKGASGTVCERRRSASARVESPVRSIARMASIYCVWSCA